MAREKRSHATNSSHFYSLLRGKFQNVWHELVLIAKKLLSLALLKEGLSLWWVVPISF